MENSFSVNSYYWNYSVDLRVIITITIIGRQYTAYSGEIPIVLTNCSSSEKIDETSGYCTDKVDYDIHEPA